MPRKFLRRYLLDRNAVRANWLLRRLESQLHHPRLWHLNRRSVAGATALGVFVAFLPIPFQMITVSLGALWLRVNLPLSLSLIFITNPFTMGPVFFSCYRLGAWLLDYPLLAFAPDRPMLGQLLAQLDRIWLPLWTGSLVVGVALALAAYSLVRIAWCAHILHRRGALVRRLSGAARG